MGKIFSGNSKISNKIGFKLKPKGILGICTSSQSVGHSVSFGESDAVVAISKNTSVADAAATAIGNAVQGEVAESVQRGIELAEKLPVEGVMIIREEHVGTYGKLPEIIEIENIQENQEKNQNKEQEGSVFDSQKGAGERNWI